MHCANFSACVVTFREGEELPITAEAVVAVVVDLEAAVFEDAGELDPVDDVMVVGLDSALATPSEAELFPHADSAKASVTSTTANASFPLLRSE
jgi:hypothetical protein